MKKIIYLAFVLVFFLQNAFAQEEPEKIIDREFARNIENIYGQLERDRVPHGLLSNIAFPFADLEAYDGSLQDSTEMAVEVYSNIYKTLLSARITPETEDDFDTLEDLAAKWASLRKEHNSDETDITLVLSGLHYKYAVIPESSVWNKSINVEGGVAQDVYVNGEWQNPYVEKETVAITPPLSVLNTLSFSVVLPEALFYSNNGDVKQIYVDFSDGKGYKPLSFDQKVAVTYPAEGKYVWKFKVERWSGPFLELESPILIDRPIDIIRPIQGKDNVLISNNIIYDAVLRIDYAPGSLNQIRKPLIVAEGFDPGSILTPEVIGGSLTLDDFLNSINQNSNLRNLLMTNNQQYDIVYVDWKNGVGDITKNAETLIKVIEWVNNEKQQNNSNEPNIVLGQSMGGLVASYALSKMEKTGKNHDTSLYIAHDTPFQGANTPISAQYMLRHARAVYISSPFIAYLGEVILPFMQSIDALVGINFMAEYQNPGTVLSINDVPAALQMTKYHISPTFQVRTQLHDTWKNQFDTMGYPQLTRNIAVSNGNMCAVPQEVAGGESMILINKSDGSTAFWENILYRLGAGIWGDVTRNWRLSIATRIPGRASYRYHLDLKAIPEQNSTSRKVYSSSVTYRVVDFLFGATFDTPVVPYLELNAPSSLLPLETFSGGFENLENVASNVDLIDIPSEGILKPRYGFIPAASALDIRRTNNALTLNDYRKAYDSYDLGDSNLTTSFHNFVTESPDLGRDNFRHISFSLKTSNWLATEIANLNDANNLEYNCTGFCNIQILGPNAICRSVNTTFSLPPLPEGTTYRWRGNGGVPIVGASDNSSVVVRTNNQNLTNGSISVEINIPNCGTITIAKEFLVGAPGAISDGIYGWATINMHISSNPNVQIPIALLDYSVDPVPNATYYEWELPGNYEEVDVLDVYPSNWQLLNSTKNTHEITARSNGEDGQVRVRACNDCSCSDWEVMNVTHNRNSSGGNGPGFDFGLHPNPNHGIFNLSLVPNSSFSFHTTTIQMYDVNSRMRHQQTIQIGTDNIIEVPHLEAGYYLLRVDLQNGDYQNINLNITNEYH